MFSKWYYSCIYIFRVTRVRYLLDRTTLKWGKQVWDRSYDSSLGKLLVLLYLLKFLL